MNEIKFYRLIEITCSIMIMGILAIIVVIDNRFPYVYQTFCVIPNVMIVIFFSFLFLLYFITQKQKRFSFLRSSGKVIIFNKMELKLERRTLILISIFMLGIQFILAWQIYFKTGWDCGKLVQMAQEVAYKYADIGDDTYFSMYPNNVLIVAIFAFILRTTQFLGFHTDYFPLIMVGCILVNLSGFFMADCIRTLTGKRWLTLCAWGLFMLLSGFSPWISIPYSDTYSIFFPICLVWLYIHKSERNKYMTWFFIGFLGMIGGLIKPTVLLTLLVITGMEFLHFLFGIKEKGVKQFFVKLILFSVTITVSVGLALCFNGYAKHKLGCNLDENKKFTPLHYLMMGLNQTTGGTYDQWDVNYSASAATVEERNQNALSAISNRLATMGPIGVVIHTVKKTLSNFNDGIFSWGNEGEFYWNISEKNTPLATILRSFYYEWGENYDLFQLMGQTMWLFTLCMIACLILRPNQQIAGYSSVYAVITLSLIAICMFVTVFEARARYLYLYSPLFVMCASLGFNRFICLLQRKAKQTPK